jgi:hypothetical protein
MASTYAKGTLNWSRRAQCSSRPGIVRQHQVSRGIAKRVLINVISLTLVQLSSEIKGALGALNKCCGVGPVGRSKLGFG